MRFSLFLAATLLLADGAVCGAAPADLPATPTPTESGRQADRVIAVLDRRVITERDFDLFLAEARIYDPGLADVADEAGRRLIVTEVVHEYLLGGWAEMQLSPLPQEAGAGWAKDAAGRFERMAGGSGRLNDILGDLDLDRARLMQWLEEAGRRRLMIREAIGLHARTGGTEMPEGAPADASRLRLAHVMVLTEGRGRQAALERALQVRRDVQAGLPFHRAAALYSDDPGSAEMGGEIGWVTRDEINPVLWQAAASLVRNGTTAPVETDSAFHVVQLLDFETPKQAEYLRKVRAEEQRQLRRLLEETDIRLADGYRLAELPAEAAGAAIAPGS